NLDPLFRKKAIYEIIFLNNEFYEVDYENLAVRERPDGSLKGFEEDIQYYFNDFSTFKTANDIENANTIINLVFGAAMNEKVGISYEELRKWFLQLYRIVNKKLLAEKDLSEKCNLIELKGNFL